MFLAPILLTFLWIIFHIIFFRIELFMHRTSIIACSDILHKAWSKTFQVPKLLAGIPAEWYILSSRATKKFPQRKKGSLKDGKSARSSNLNVHIPGATTSSWHSPIQTSFTAVLGALEVKGSRSISLINHSTTFDKNPSKHDHIHGDQPWEGHEVAKKRKAGAGE